MRSWTILPITTPPLCHLIRKNLVRLSYLPQTSNVPTVLGHHTDYLPSFGDIQGLFQLKRLIHPAYDVFRALTVVKNAIEVCAGWCDADIQTTTFWAFQYLPETGG